MQQVIIAGLILGGLGLIFGLLLTIASKKFHVEEDPRIAQVREHLAGANCGACGYPGCDGCAKAIVEGQASVSACPPAGEKAAKEIAAVMGVDAQDIEPVVARVMCQGTIGVADDRYIYDGYQSCHTAAKIAGGPKKCLYSCIGLGDCMEHCAFDAITMRGGVAHIDGDLCRACGACVSSCPRGVIRMVPKSRKVMVRCHNRDSAKVAYTVCMRSCIGCSRCVKACKYDAIHVVDGVAQIDYSKCTMCGECAAVCPRKSITVD